MNQQKNNLVTDDKENFDINIKQMKNIKSKTIVNPGKNGLKKVKFVDEVKKLSDPVIMNQPAQMNDSLEKEKTIKVDEQTLIQKDDSLKLLETIPKKNINEQTLYIDRENSLLLKQYGADVYEYSKELEIDTMDENFISKHKIISEVRTKMVDWMIEVLSVYKSENETFYLSVYIMDKFISLSQTPIKTDDIHLIGITSMFIASKFEDIMPIRMSSFVYKIGHSQFTE